MASNLKNRLFSLFAFIAIASIIGVTDAKRTCRISGALDAEPGVFTWIVSIGVSVGLSYPSHLCGGAIISPRHILTAGHCPDGQNLKKLSVRGGITHLHDNNAVVANVAKIIMHPDYVPQIDNVRAVENDIAVLVLDRDLNLGERLTKVSLPDSMLKNHQQASIAGWGHVSEVPVNVKTLTLQTDGVEYLDDETCRQPVGPQFFCGIQKNGNILTGDSGSPLVSGGAVVGVVSSGWGFVHIADFYTNVYHYRDWIDDIIADASSSA